MEDGFVHSPFVAEALAQGPPLHPSDEDRPVLLNVGGRKVDTFTSTLVSAGPGSMLVTLVAGPFGRRLDRNQRILLDRDPKLFARVLEWLRNRDAAVLLDRSTPGQNETLRRRLVAEADFYGIKALVAALDELEPVPPSIEAPVAPSFDASRRKQSWMMIQEGIVAEVFEVRISCPCQASFDPGWNDWFRDTCLSPSGLILCNELLHVDRGITAPKGARFERVKRVAVAATALVRVGWRVRHADRTFVKTHSGYASLSSMWVSFDHV